MSDYSQLPEDWARAGLNTIPVLTPQASTLPVYSCLFKAFHLCPLDRTKVVMLGQDPYPTIGYADGLAFSTSVKPTPTSLRTMRKELYRDLKIDKLSGDLSGWAKQGVLLLNAALTVEIGKPESHLKRWRPFLKEALEVLNETKPKVFVFLGSRAQYWGEYVDRNRHFVLNFGHPSGFNRANSFAGCGMFSKINAALKVLNEKPIEWGA